MGSLGAGVAGDLGCPVFALPVDQMVRHAARVFFHTFPPDITVIGERDIGKDHIVAQAGHAVRVGVVVGAGGYAEVARFGVNGVELAVGMRFDPRNIVANGADLPAGKSLRRHQHREIGFAASAGEGCCHMVFFARRIGHTQNQHVLCQPALVTAHGGRDAQRKALLAQQGVAAVAGAVGPDFTCFGEMHDVLGLVARPFHVGLACSQRSAHGVHARHKIAVGSQHVVHRAAHAGHDALVDRNIGAVADLDADVRNVRTQRAHRKRHHIHGATGHAAVKQRAERCAHLAGFHPIVGRAGVFFAGAANIGAVFHSGHVARVGAGQKAVGALGGVELGKGACIHQTLAQGLVFLLGAVTPVDGSRFAQGCHVGDPGDQAGMLNKIRGIEFQPAHHR